MRKIVFIALTLFAASVQAQYFQHLYGYKNAIGSIPMNGMTTTAIGDGHLVGGLYVDVDGFPIHQGNYGIYVLRTDIDGRFTSANDFNNGYLLTDGTQKLRFTAGLAVEFTDGSGYGAVGSYYLYSGAQIATQGLAYVRLDANGNVMTVQGYHLSNHIGGTPFINGLREATDGSGDLFATGTNLDANDGDKIWAMRIDANGGLIWGEIYNAVCTPNDIIHSPYSAKTIIVGEYAGKGFWMDVDPATGALFGITTMNSFFGTAERLISIDLDQNSAIPGFIVAGESDGRAWVTKTDQTGGMIWSGRYWSLTTPTKSLSGYDAVARPKGDDPNGTEYYVTGPYWSNSTDGDAFVFKLDNNGDPINPNGLFLYNGGTVETGVNIDVNLAGTADGIGMYAVNEYVPSPQKEVYIVKSYFNGVSGCNEYFEDLDRQVMEFFPDFSEYVTSTSFSTTQVSLYSILADGDTELCHSTTISSGDNALVAPAEPKGDEQGTVWPNPVQNTATNVVVEVFGQTPANVDIAIYDMLGREYYNGNFNIQKGHNRLPLNIAATNMAAGMYTVKVRGIGISENILLQVK